MHIVCPCLLGGTLVEFPGMEGRYQYDFAMTERGLGDFRGGLFWFVGSEQSLAPKPAYVKYFGWKPELP